MRKLTPEERAAKKAGQVAEVVVAAEPKKKAKKAEKVVDAEPKGIGADSFVMPSGKSIKEEAPVAAEKDEKVTDSAPASEEDSAK